MTSWSKPESKESTESKKRKKASFAYFALLTLSMLYFCRPEDVVPGLGIVPLAKISGGIALIALFFTLQGSEKVKLAPDTKLLFLFFLWYCAGIPFAMWRGGAFMIVMTRLSKSIITVLMVSLLARDLWQLRRLMWVQAAAVAAMTILSVAAHRMPNGRLSGVVGGVFENPNDLAINIALNWPLCVGFFFLARGAFRKLLWGASVLIMLGAVQLTYSRAGFLALALAAMLVVWEFAIRGKRRYLIVVAGVLGVALLVFAPGHYGARLASIVTGNEEYGMDRGSREARKQLIIESLKVAAHNPLFGVGAGNFLIAGGHFHVAHSTYTEIAAEGGFPACILFLSAIWLAFRCLRQVKKSQVYNSIPEVRIFTGTLWVALVAYLIGATFASTEYSMYPYFLFGYITALHRITNAENEPAEAAEKSSASKFGRKSVSRQARQPAWLS